MSCGGGGGRGGDCRDGAIGDDANADANANAPIPANDAFVSSILERGRASRSSSRSAS